MGSPKLVDNTQVTEQQLQEEYDAMIEEMKNKRDHAKEKAAELEKKMQAAEKIKNRIRQENRNSLLRMYPQSQEMTQIIMQSQEMTQTNQESEVTLEERSKYYNTEFKHGIQLMKSKSYDSTYKDLVHNRSALFSNKNNGDEKSPLDHDDVVTQYTNMKISNA